MYRARSATAKADGNEWRREIYMKLSERGRLIVNAMCTVEQWSTLVFFVWLVGWKGWNPWWMLLAVLLILAGSPSGIIKALEKEYD